MSAWHVDEYDVSSHEIAEFMSKEEAVKKRRTAAKLNYLSLFQSHDCFFVKRGFKLNVFFFTTTIVKTKNSLQSQFKVHVSPNKIWPNYTRPAWR